MEERVIVRRAGKRDLPTIVGLINSAHCRPNPVTHLDAARLLLARGLWLSLSPTSAGLACWQAENLVTCIDALYVFPPSRAAQLVPPLLKAVEQAARELQCEIAAAITPAPERAHLDPVVAACGYTLRPIAGLDRIWREMLTQLAPAHETSAWVKQLRSERVLAPI